MLTQPAIVAPACDEHLGIAINQPPPIGDFRRRRARGVVQLDIFGGDSRPRPANAIEGHR